MKVLSDQNLPTAGRRQLPLVCVALEIAVERGLAVEMDVGLAAELELELAPELQLAAKPDEQ